MSRRTRGYDNMAKHSATGALELADMGSLTSCTVVQDESRWETREASGRRGDVWEIAIAKWLANN